MKSLLPRFSSSFLLILPGLLTVSGCRTPNSSTSETRETDDTRNTDRADGKWKTTPGFAYWVTQTDKPTWIFNYSFSPEGARRDPQRYLRDGQSQWNHCRDLLIKGDVNGAKNGICSNGGVWRGTGLYFAQDPFSSSAYGDTMIAVRIKPNINIPSLYKLPANRSAWGEEYNEQKIDGILEV